MPSSDLNAIYKKYPVTLCVEDELTSTYLDAAWGAQSHIGFLVAGNSGAVKNLVEMARRNKSPNVFGLIDRDFMTGGVSEWSSSTQVFRLDTHEIENFLLDSELLAGNILDRVKRTPEQVFARLHDAASTMVWGMALGATTYWMVGERNRDFPSQGSLANVPDEAAALKRIYGNNWLVVFAALPTMIGRPAVEKYLKDRHVEFNAMLATSDWLTHFGGKELLGAVLGYVVSAEIPGRREDWLAKEVGALQRARGRVPSEITKLYALLLGVAGTPQRPM